MYNLMKWFTYWIHQSLIVTRLNARETVVFTDLTSVHFSSVGSKRGKAMLFRQDTVAMDSPVLNLPRLQETENIEPVIRAE